MNMTCINYARCVYAWMGKYLLSLITADFSRLGALDLSNAIRRTFVRHLAPF